MKPGQIDWQNVTDQAGGGRVAGEEGAQLGERTVAKAVESIRD